MINKMMQLFISRIPRLNTSERLIISDLFSSIKEVMDLSLKDMEQILHKQLTGIVYNPLQYKIEVDSILNIIEHSKVDILYYWDIC